MLNIKQNKAFTLVELIVVITIISILGTIAFISLQWYNIDARNSNRVTDIKSVETSLELFVLDTSKYPIPDSYTGVTLSWELLWYAWDIDDGILVNLWRLSNIPKDPKNWNNISYSTTYSRSEYQLKYELELANNSHVMSQSYANDTIPLIRGKYNSLFLVSSSWSYYAVPSLHSDGTIFSLNKTKINFIIKDLWVNKDNIKSNLDNFSLALQSAYSGAIEINSDWVYEQLLSVDSWNLNDLEELATLLTWISSGPSDGICGGDNGLWFLIPPTNLCSLGLATAVIDNWAGSTYSWDCGWVNWWNNKSCSANNINMTSCQEILADNPSSTDGIYQISLLEGNINVYCDMTTDGGWWTLTAVTWSSSNTTNLSPLMWNNATWVLTDPNQNSPAKLSFVNWNEIWSLVRWKNNTVTFYSKHGTWAITVNGWIPAYNSEPIPSCSLDGVSFTPGRWYHIVDCFDLNSNAVGMYWNSYWNWWWSFYTLNTIGWTAWVR